MVDAHAPAEHQPVLLKEVIDSLLHDVCGHYVDATFGRGGHTRALLKRLSNSASVLGLDRDPRAIEAGEVLASEDKRFAVVHARFSQIADIVALHAEQPIAGILMDLGVSSPQLDGAERGFSFRLDGPLDMRMDTSETAGASAAEWLNEAEQADIAEVLFQLGEERQARRIAAAIVRQRPLQTTTQLAALIEEVVPRRSGSRKHPATKSFQAIRMHINEEPAELRSGLEGAFAALGSGGRLAVISFHSLEDRVVKRTFKTLTQPPPIPRRIPLREDARPVRAKHIAGPLRASTIEVANNPRARSATLRVIEKLHAPATAVGER